MLAYLLPACMHFQKICKQNMSSSTTCFNAILLRSSPMSIMSFVSLNYSSGISLTSLLLHVWIMWLILSSFIILITCKLAPFCLTIWQPDTASFLCKVACSENAEHLFSSFHLKASLAAGLVCVSKLHRQEGLWEMMLCIRLSS